MTTHNMSTPYREPEEIAEEIPPMPEDETPFWSTERKVLAIIACTWLLGHVGAVVAEWGQITHKEVGAVMILNAAIGAVVGIAYVTFPRS